MPRRPRLLFRAAPPGFALAAAMLGFAVVALDAQIVKVALPVIRGDLGGGLSGLQCVVTGYTLAFSALQLIAGSVADRVGARRAYGAGMVLFVLGDGRFGRRGGRPGARRRADRAGLAADLLREPAGRRTRAGGPGPRHAVRARQLPVRLDRTGQRCSAWSPSPTR
ncbi:MAG TPA: MFS transporter [Actinomycetales bacterium]|nr:MFS transporter [Actinomycetales bacterium]